MCVPTRVARQAYQSRLQTLRARVDPTFLFETLRVVEAHYRVDHQRGEMLLDALIVYLRAALPALETHSSSLAAELTRFLREQDHRRKDDPSAEQP